MRELSYLDKIALVLTWFENGIDPDNNVGIQRFSRLGISTAYEYLTGIVNLILTGRFFDTIIDANCSYHALTYLPNQHYI